MILELTAAVFVAFGIAAMARRYRGRAPRGPALGGSTHATVERFAVGDVLLWGKDELWLAGALRLREVGPVLALFRTPGASAEWFAVLDGRGEELAALSASERIDEGPMPAELRIEGHLLRLQRRGDAEITLEGEMLPAIHGPVSYTVLASLGGRLAVVVEPSRGQRLALLGRRVEPEHLEVLAARDPSRALRPDA